LSELPERLTEKSFFDPEEETDLFKKLPELIISSSFPIPSGYNV